MRPYLITFEIKHELKQTDALHLWCTEVEPELDLQRMKGRLCQSNISLHFQNTVYMQSDG